MKKEENSDKINQVFIDSIQEMGFIDVIPFTDTKRKMENPVSVKINILMPYLHDVIISFDYSLALGITQTLLGKDNAESKIYDAIGEFANVFSGKIFEKIAADTLFELGYPEKIDINTLNRTHYIIQRFITPENQLVEFYRRFIDIKKS